MIIYGQKCIDINYILKKPEMNGNGCDVYKLIFHYYNKQKCPPPKKKKVDVPPHLRLYTICHDI